MLVSVVIPSYNHKDYVLKAIESVLNQRGPHIDLIVIDDGSTDGSADLIEAYHRRDGGFRFVRRENRGLIKSLNEGLRLSQGELFCELASDDYLPSNSIELRTSFMQEHRDCVAVFADGLIVKGKEQTQETFGSDKRRRMFAMKDPIPEMLKGVFPVFSTGLLRTDVLRRVGGFDEENFRYYEDLDTPIRLAMAGKLGFLEAPVIFRRLHDTNVSGSTPHIRLEKAHLYSKLLKDSRMAPYRSLLRRCFRRSLLALGRQLELEGAELLRGSSVFREGWAYLWRDPRLLKPVLKWGRC